MMKKNLSKTPRKSPNDIKKKNSSAIYEPIQACINEELKSRKSDLKESSHSMIKKSSIKERIQHKRDKSPSFKKYLPDETA